MMDRLKNKLFIRQPKERGDAALLKEHIPQLHSPEVSVDAGGDDDAGATAVA